jgi:anti-repressor protein
MNELIEVTTNENDEQVVSARELHKALEISKRFSAWWEQNSKMLVENEDFMGVPQGTPIKNGKGRIQYLEDFVLTIDTAKHLAMQSQTEKGREVRDYFIKAEKAWNSEDMILQRSRQILERRLDRLQIENSQLQATNSKLAVENEAARPKVEYFDELVDRNMLTSFRDTAKLLNVKQRRFIDFLLDKKYVYRDKKGKLTPFAQYDNNLFEIKESKNEKTAWAGTQTLITPKGRETFKLLTI